MIFVVFFADYVRRYNYIIHIEHQKRMENSTFSLKCKHCRETENNTFVEFY